MGAGLSYVFVDRQSIDPNSAKGGPNHRNPLNPLKILIKLIIVGHKHRVIPAQAAISASAGRKKVPGLSKIAG
ncbi:MAG: hypothetical protein VW802_05175 [Rhodospirillaceae bacterium]|jgi:hypothetical protein